jgi:hypothetical protein
MVQHDYVPKPFSPDNYWRKSGNTYRRQALIVAVHESAYGAAIRRAYAIPNFF